MAEKDQGKIVRIPLGNGAELQIPQEQAHNMHAAHLEAKYSFEIRESALVRDGEQPDAYVSRMLELFPAPEQQAYIRALHAITPLGEYAPYALQGFAENQELDPKIIALYPPELNGHIVGKGLEDKSLWRLRANPGITAEVISACNLGSYSIRNFGERKVREARRMVEAVVLGQKKLEGVAIPDELKIGVNQLAVKAAEKLVGQELVEQLVRTEVEKLITTRSLQLSTDSTADAFKEISHYVGGEFDPLSLLATTVFSAQLSLDDLDIYPEIGKNILDIHDKAITKPPKPAET